MDPFETSDRRAPPTLNMQRAASISNMSTSTRSSLSGRKLKHHKSDGVPPTVQHLLCVGQYTVTTELVDIGDRNPPVENTISHTKELFAMLSFVAARR